MDTRETPAVLRVDPAAVADRIAEVLRRQLGDRLHRRGFVVAISGGVDSSVCACLATRAVGAAHVLGLFLPDRDTDPGSRPLFEQLVGRLGIANLAVDITPILEAAGCYRERDAAIQRVVPRYSDGWKSKLVIPAQRLDSDVLNVTHLAVQPPGGDVRTVRLPSAEYRTIVAATNFKQRVRTMLSYFHADRLHYAVVGTPNRVEYDQGFFVKGGDGLADVKPIAHLYKSQVYQLAGYLGVPEGVTARAPTTDTFPLSQSQEEFYFALPTATMDQVLWAANAGWNADRAGREFRLTAEQVERAYRDIAQKRATTRYLHSPALLVEPVPPIHPESDA